MAMEWRVCEGIGLMTTALRKGGAVGLSGCTTKGKWSEGVGHDGWQAGTDEPFR